MSRKFTEDLNQTVAKLRSNRLSRALSAEISSERLNGNGSFPSRMAHRILVPAGAAVLTLLFFMVLPLMQTISKPPAGDLIVQSVDTVSVPPPPPPQEEEGRTSPEDKPPELTKKRRRWIFNSWSWH